MKKELLVTLNMPVTLRVVAEEKHGEVNVISIRHIDFPSLSDISDASTEDNLAAIDEAWQETGASNEDND